MDLSNTVLVTHKGCMDGSASALVFLAAGGEKKNVYFTLPSHDDSDEIVNWLSENHNGPILVADVSISYALAKKLDSRGCDIRLLDHHKTAIPLSEFSWCEIEKNNTRSGAKMLYDFFRNCDDLRIRNWTLDLKDLVNVVDDHDRWIHNDSRSEDLVMLHDFVGQEIFIERFISDPEVEFTEKEEYVLDIKKRKRDSYIQQKVSEAFYRMIEVDGKQFKVAVVECGDYQSFVGNYLCDKVENPADVAVLINSKSVSFRGSSKCPVDLSKIAKMNFGGGHQLASGTSIGNVLGADFIETVFERIKWQ